MAGAQTSASNAQGASTAEGEARALAVKALCRSEPELGPGPAPSFSLSGDETQYRPQFGSESEDCTQFEVTFDGHLTVESVSAFQVDRDGNEYSEGTTFRPRARLGSRYSSGLGMLPMHLDLVYEHDLYTGIVGGDSNPLDDSVTRELELYPGHRAGDQELRKAYARLSFGRALHVSAGWMTSYWGLGLVANDGAHGWAPGTARFADPISGDRVLRALIATGPHTDLGLVAAIGGDLVDPDLLSGDDVLLPGDKAKQVVAAISLGEGKAHGIGLYGALRKQEAEDGDETHVTAFDIYGRTKHQLRGAWFSLQAEAAYITGTTELAPSTAFTEHDVSQLGIALRADLDAGLFGSVVDVLYASGDSDLDDANQHAFRADPNYEMGLLLYRHVLAAQTARGVVTAADTNLVGVPAEDRERIATRGSATNTLAVFPRLRVRPTDGFEVYGGALFAFAPSLPADPFNSRVIGGGSARNALGAMSSHVLGTEYDVGLRFRVNLNGMEGTLGAEGGVFTPGDAFSKTDGQHLPTVGAMRLLLDTRI
ncbi:MAG: hypothetical protein H6718_22100 [Polyangiaceae bacterium]|nr:hypothetical protein [Polyangiaceae bacterium]